MSDNQDNLHENGDKISPLAIAEALVRGPFAYTDGTAQVFTADGRTMFTERNGATTSGEWGVDERGRFWSFWPPSYRADYDVFWLVDDGDEVGVRFIDRTGGAVSEGRYTRL